MTDPITTGTPMPITPSPFLVFMPTYAPDTEAIINAPNKRGYKRLSQEEISSRINTLGFMSRLRPWVYMDCIDSVINIRPDVDLVAADARSTDSIRDQLVLHQRASFDLDHSGYDLALFERKESQWKALNRILEIHDPYHERKYLIYTSSDIVWTHDWITPAVKHFDADPTLQMLFPCVNSGDPNLPVQIAPGPRDLPLIDPALHMDNAATRAARAPVLNAYAFICRMDFIKAYGGYPNIFRNCFTESFLYYMCEAIGGKMRLMPEGWVYHHGALDAHTHEDGGLYNHTAEKPAFDRIMNEVQAARASGALTKDMLKGWLYA